MSVKKPDPVDEHVGRQIRAARNARRKSQTKLAEALGVTFQQVQKYEKGVNRVGAGRLTAIASFLQVPVTSLFEGHPDTAAPTVPLETPCLNLAQTRSGTRVAKAFLVLERQNRPLAQSFLETLECAAYGAAEQDAA